MAKEQKDIKAIFSEVIEKQTPEEQAAYLDEGFAQAVVTPEVIPGPSGEGVQLRLVIEEGQRVKKGQALVELGSELLQKNLQAR